MARSLPVPPLCPHGQCPLPPASPSCPAMLTWEAPGTPVHSAPASVTVTALSLTMTTGFFTGLPSPHGGRQRTAPTASAQPPALVPFVQVAVTSSHPALTTAFPLQGEPGEAGEPGLPGEGGPPVSAGLEGGATVQGLVGVPILPQRPIHKWGPRVLWWLPHGAPQKEGARVFLSCVSSSACAHTCVCPSACFTCEGLCVLACVCGHTDTLAVDIPAWLQTALPSVGSRPFRRRRNVGRPSPHQPRPRTF